MTYLFKSKATGDLLMLQANGDQLLRIIGKQPAARGIIEPAAMPAAILALDEAVRQDEAARSQAPQAAAHEEQAKSDGEDVSLGQRARPLVEMMKSSHAMPCDIVWGV